MNIMISHSPRLPTRWYLHIYQDHIHSNNRNKSTSIDYTSIYDGVVCACLQCVFAFTPLITYQEVCPNTLLLFAAAPTLGLIAYYTHTAHDLEPAPSTAKVPKRLFSLSWQIIQAFLSLCIFFSTVCVLKCVFAYIFGVGDKQRRNFASFRASFPSRAWPIYAIDDTMRGAHDTIRKHIYEYSIYTVSNTWWLHENIPFTLNPYLLKMRSSVFGFVWWSLAIRMRSRCSTTLRFTFNGERSSDFIILWHWPNWRGCATRFFVGYSLYILRVTQKYLLFFELEVLAGNLD